MALDAALKLRDAAFNGAYNTVVNSTAIALGRVGLPFGSAFLAGIQTPAGAGGTSLHVVLQVSLDNGTTWGNYGSIYFGDPDQTFSGKKSVGVDLDFTAQEYADLNIDVRCAVAPIGNASNNMTAAKIWAYLGAPERSSFGRAAAADTLMV